MKTGCIILAGGKSSRMGEDKALLKYEGRNFIEKIAEELSFFEEKIIARGNNSTFEKITDSRWKIIPDIYPEHGPMGGIHAALKECNSEAMFVVTCDMPLITEKLVKNICNEMTSSCKRTIYDAVITVTDDGKYHPLFGTYRKTLWPAMEEHLQMNHNRVIAVLEKCNVKYIHLDKETSRQLANVNTKEEYEKLVCNEQTDTL